jgi:cytochrome c oxidase cbb3-type subunit 3
MKNQIKYIGFTGLFMLFTNSIKAQETVQAAVTTNSAQEFNNLMQVIFFGIIAVLAVVSAWIAVRTLKMYQDMLSAANAKLEGREIPVQQPTPSVLEGFLSKLWYQMTGTGAVAIEREKDILIEHPHDGIYELDNRLPPWWLNMFYITILFSFGYMAYYHFDGGGKLQLDEYKEEMQKGQIEKAMAADLAANAVNENNVTSLKDQASLLSGETIFIGKCAACHGQKGEGGVGPNMTDDYWIHGGSIKDLFRTITNGVPDKGMIAWNTQLRPVEIQEVSSYILTLRGTNPPNAKAAQGTLYTPESGTAPAAKDTTIAAPKAADVISK